ncbi:MAG: hypothetical protein R3288_00140 [Woeseiaceae bacterium]|nr:hypothetical protein [Woeseiaceae bacterium]
MDPSTDDDTLLSAYLDGELPQHEADLITERLAREPDLMRRLEAMQAGDEATRQVFATLDERPMPQAVLDMLGGRSTRRSADVIAFPARMLRQFTQAPVAIAASVALVAGFLISDVMRDAPQVDVDLYQAGAVAADSPLHELLERGLSGDPQALADGATGEVLLTFEDRRGDFCRQLAIGGSAETLHGVACQRGERWQIEALGYAPASPDGGPFVPAGSTTPDAVNAAIDALIGASDPLGPDEEKRLISEGWKKIDD